jgi:hypothetical protein
MYHLGCLGTWEYYNYKALMALMMSRYTASDEPLTLGLFLAYHGEWLGQDPSLLVFISNVLCSWKFSFHRDLRAVLGAGVWNRGDGSYGVIARIALCSTCETARLWQGSLCHSRLHLLHLLHKDSFSCSWFVFIPISSSFLNLLLC